MLKVKGGYREGAAGSSHPIHRFRGGIAPLRFQNSFSIALKGKKT